MMSESSIAALPYGRKTLVTNSRTAAWKSARLYGPQIKRARPRLAVCHQKGWLGVTGPTIAGVARKWCVDCCEMGARRAETKSLALASAASTSVVMETAKSTHSQGLRPLRQGHHSQHFSHSWNNRWLAYFSTTRLGESENLPALIRCVYFKATRNNNDKSDDTSQVNKIRAYFLSNYLQKSFLAE